jgi:hypothetical protein
VIDLVYEILKLISPEQLLMALIGSYGILLAITKFSSFVVTKLVELSLQGVHWSIGALPQKNAEIFSRGTFLNVVNGFGIGVLLMVLNMFLGPDVRLAFTYEGFGIFLDVHWFLNILGIMILIFGWACVVYVNIRAWYEVMREQRLIARTMPWARGIH